MSLSEIKRKDLMALIYTGIIDQEFDIATQDGIQKVRMVLLAESEDIDCQKIAGQWDLITREKIYRIEVLSRAIMDINGQGFGDEKTKIDILRDFLDKLQTPIIVQLWDCYLNLRTSQQMMIGNLQPREVKNSSGNPKN